jgi:hypothetical protein
MLSPETFANFEKLVSEETRAAAKTLVVAENLGGPNSKRAFNRALSSIGLNGLIFRGNPIGVFMGAVDRESIEAIAIGNPRQNRPILSWNLAVQKFRSDFGEAPDLVATIATQNGAMRTEAIEKRRERATGTTLSEIRLCKRLRDAVDRSIGSCDPNLIDDTTQAATSLAVRTGRSRPDSP